MSSMRPTYGSRKRPGGGRPLCELSLSKTKVLRGVFQSVFTVRFSDVWVCFTSHRCFFYVLCGCCVHIAASSTHSSRKKKHRSLSFPNLMVAVRDFISPIVGLDKTSVWQDNAPLTLALNLICPHVFDWHFGLLKLNEWPSGFQWL